MRWVTWYADNREENGVKEEYLRIVIYAPGEQVDKEKVVGRARYTIEGESK